MIVASHRGPVAFRRDGEGFRAVRGAGGLVSVLWPLLTRNDDARWFAAAMSDEDRAAVAAGRAEAPGFHLRLLALDPETHRQHYEVISNELLWFLHHGLFDLPTDPRFDGATRTAWDAYVEVNRRFATAIAEDAAERDTVLVQDFQLALVPGLLRDLRPDLRIAAFTHIPFCGPNSIRVLPEPIARTLLSTMRRTPVGFHTERWARAYRASAAEVLGGSTDTPTFASAFCPDLDELRAEAASPRVREAVAGFDALAGDRRLIVRSDRIEPSKNIVRGLLAFETLLDERPEWRGRVVLAALVNPSRETLGAYQRLRGEVTATVERINDRWARGDWTPVILDARDDYARSLAGLARADVLLVNPIRDGLNLVAKEGPIVNERDAPLCLSRDAGAFDDLDGACLEVQPYDLLQTAATLHAALTMEPAERSARAEALRARIGARRPVDWLGDQLAHAD